MGWGFLSGGVEGGGGDSMRRTFADCSGTGVSLEGGAGALGWGEVAPSGLTGITIICLPPR